MTHSTAMLLVAVLSLAALTASRAAPPVPADGEVALILDQGFPHLNKAGQPARIDLEMDLVRRNGEWVKEFWGTQFILERRYAVRSAYSKRDFEFRIVKAEKVPAGERLTIDGVLPRDIWGTPGGNGQWEVEIVAAADNIVGTYKASFSGQKAEGKAKGKLMPLYDTPIPGFQPIKPGEHPRLAFRKGDIPAIRERAMTPQGQAIIAQLKALLAGRKDNYTEPYHAAGWGLLYIVEDNPAHAETARAIVERIVFGKSTGVNPWRKNAEKERHNRAAPAAGIIMAFDMCYDAWPRDFRDRLVPELEKKTQEMIEGSGREEYNDSYPSNHVAICQGVGAMGALALLGEPGTYPEAPIDPTALVEAPYEAPKDFTPGVGVPIVKLPHNRVITDWIYSGALKPESVELDFLKALGGRAGARPAVGTEVVYDGGKATFKLLDPKEAVWNHARNTGGQDFLDLVVPIQRNYNSTIIFFTVIENDEPRLVQYQNDHGGSRTWLAGRELPRGAIVRLGKGRFPLLMQTRVGTTDPWGKIWATPKFVATSDDQVKATRAQHAAAMGDWEAGRTKWEANGREVPTVRRLLGMAYWNLRRHKNYSTGDLGWYNEGDGYRRYGGTVGMLPFEVAWRNTMGSEFGGSEPGYGMYVPLFASRLLNWGGKPVQGHYGPGGEGWSSDLWRSGDFVLGFAHTPEKLKPACKWVFDRFWGMEGNKTFDIAMPHQAAYALAHYPFDTPAKNPGDMLAKAMLDRRKGFAHFRNQWKDADDFAICIYGKTDPVGGGWSFADGSSFRIFGMQTPFARKGGGNSDGGPEFENVVRIPGTNGWLGGQVTHFAPRPDGGGVVSYDTSDIYLGGRKDDKTPADARIVGGQWVDLGIRGQRSFAVDYSGKSGATVLVAVADRIRPNAGAKMPGEPVWQMHCGGDLKIQGNRFTVGGRNGSTLAGAFVAPADVKLAQNGSLLTATGGSDFLVVMTIQKGAAPEVKPAPGIGGATVGGQRITFDGKDLILAD